jgi:hypothetical protein
MNTVQRNIIFLLKLCSPRPFSEIKIQKNVPDDVFYNDVIKPLVDVGEIKEVNKSSLQGEVVDYSNKEFEILWRVQ